MTTAPLAHTDVIVLDYLAALWAQSEDLSPEQRDSLMSTVADYIAARRVAAVDPLEDAAAIVRRLGPPEDLVAAMRRGALPPHVRLPALVLPPPPAPPVPPARSGPGGAEYAAGEMLTAGAFVLPAVAPVAGMLLATASPHWTPAQKVTGWALTAGTVAGGFVLTVLFTAMPFSSPFELVLIYMAMCFGSIAAGAVLLAGLRNKPA
ncbi:HAAS signaling domain-containing protein [Paractinoplanes durhamensis]|uniref:HAAS signaling domain-containing protein n=1 Tax=Paractinoplanes durhamensis TaxID=113563 RepID=UPI0031D45EF6